MIDAHCHLEQTPYDVDRDDVIKKCKKEGLRGVVFSCAHPQDFKKSLEIAKTYPSYAFMNAGLHPEFIKDITVQVKKEFFENVKANSKMIYAIGETGLDFNWTKEPEWRERQKALFVEMIRFANEIGKPLVIHARDAYVETIEILENEGEKHVLMHMFGDKSLTQRVIGNGWYISTNAIVLKSKNHRKIVKDTPSDRLLLETDAPWLHPDGHGRNDPTSIKIIAEKIAELTGRPFDDVWQQCGENAVKFFELPIEI